MARPYNGLLLLLLLLRAAAAVRILILIIVRSAKDRDLSILDLSRISVRMNNAEAVK